MCIYKLEHLWKYCFSQRLLKIWNSSEKLSATLFLIWGTRYTYIYFRYRPPENKFGLPLYSLRQVYRSFVLPSFLGVEKKTNVNFLHHVRHLFGRYGRFLWNIQRHKIHRPAISLVQKCISLYKQWKFSFFFLLSKHLHN